MYTILGLGNPTQTYASTRHNVGWIVLDTVFPDIGWEHNHYANAHVAETIVKEQSVRVVKPMTYMNNSGETVGYLYRKAGLVPEQLIVLYDDLDIPLGATKISFNRGDGGHNGIKSIEEHLGSREFIRIRIGIAMEQDGQVIKPNVLGNFNEAELETVSKVAKKVGAIIETIVTQGVAVAMNEFNKSDA